MPVVGVDNIGGALDIINAGYVSRFNVEDSSLNFAQHDPARDIRLH